MESNINIAVNKLMKVSRLHKRLIDSRVTEIGIHRTGHRILMHLARAGGLPSQKTLAEHFEITPAAITGALQKLENDGCIQRNIGTDNRFNEITITEKGREIVENTKKLFSMVDESLFEGFTDGEISEFSSYLERIITNLKGE